MPTDPLIGQQDKLVRLQRALVTNNRRMVTLLGTGGVGKARLVLHTAVDLAEHFADGVAVTALASITNAAHLVTATAAVGCPLPGASQPETM